MGILRLNCPHCPTDQVAFEVAWAAKAERQGHWFISALCGSCGKPICADLRHRVAGNTTSPVQVGGDVTKSFYIASFWPYRTTPAAPNHTPEPVRNRFLEGEKAYRGQSWNAAVAMYRSALDIATKALSGVPVGQSFFQRLKWLHEHHRITPDMKDWADHVRIDGNEALHDPDDFTEEDAKPLRLFTETFLRYIFELPGEVLAYRAQALPAPEPEPMPGNIDPLRQALIEQGQG